MRFATTVLSALVLFLASPLARAEEQAVPQFQPPRCSSPSRPS